MTSARRGPRMSRGRRPRNALWHGLAARGLPGSPEDDRLKVLVSALTLEIGASPVIRPAILNYAAAQVMLERVNAYRVAILDGAAQGFDQADGVSANSAFEMASELLLLDRVLQYRPHVPAGQVLKTMGFVAEFDNPLRRGSKVLEDLGPFLDALKRYERRAISARRRAIEQITGYQISGRYSAVEPAR